MKLYFAPGSCALSPHIVLEELGLPYELDKVDNRAKKTQDGGDFLAVNSRGYVPALQLDDGEVLVEGAAIVQYLGDLVPEQGLVPHNGTMERVRLQEWLGFIATELHKGFSPFFNPRLPDESKAILRERLVQRYDWLAKEMVGKEFVMGEHFTVADAYLFTILRWGTTQNQMEVSKWPVLKAYADRIAARPAVHRAMLAQGLIKA